MVLYVQNTTAMSRFDANTLFYQGVVFGKLKILAWVTLSRILLLKLNE